jgi:hypothetical protein
MFCPQAASTQRLAARPPDPAKLPAVEPRLVVCTAGRLKMHDFLNWSDNGLLVLLSVLLLAFCFFVDRKGQCREGNESAGQPD